MPEEQSFFENIALLFQSLNFQRLLLYIALPLGIGLFVYLIILSVVRRYFIKRKKEIPKWIRYLRNSLRILLLVLTVFLLARYLNQDMLDELLKTMSFFNEPIIPETSITIFTLILTIPVIWFAAAAGSFIRNLLNKGFLQQFGLDEFARYSVSNLLRYLTMVLVLLVGLSVIGINLSALTLIFSVFGIGLGFGLQSVVANFFAGIILVLTRPIKEGDRILVNGYDASVKHIRSLSTIITTIQEETIILPNHVLLDNNIHNYSFDDRRIIIRNEVEVSYSADVERALEILKELAADNPHALSYKEPYSRFDSFQSSGLKLLLFTWIQDVQLKYEASSWNNVEIWKRFKEAGIEIPFTQIVLHQAQPPKKPEPGAEDI
jgi:potassium efflux system protein